MGNWISIKDQKPFPEEHIVLVKLVDGSPIEEIVDAPNGQLEVKTWDGKFFIPDQFTGLYSKRTGGHDITEWVDQFCDEIGYDLETSKYPDVPTDPHMAYVALKDGYPADLIRGQKSFVYSWDGKYFIDDPSKGSVCSIQTKGEYLKENALDITEWVDHEIDMGK